MHGVGNQLKDIPSPNVCKDKTLLLYLYMFIYLSKLYSPFYLEFLQSVLQGWSCLNKGSLQYGAWMVFTFVCDTHLPITKACCGFYQILHPDWNHTYSKHFLLLSVYLLYKILHSCVYFFGFSC